MRQLWLCILLVATLPLMAEKRQGYRVERVEVPIARKQTAAGYLLIPDRVPKGGCPAVVACHDHGARFTIGKEKLCYPLEEGTREEAQSWVNKFYEGQFVADTLASQGYVVMVIDALYWGSRCTDTKKSNQELKAEQPAFYEELLAETGMPWFEQILADDKACVSYLCKRKEVNKRQIGVWGFSMGAYRAWQLAAEDKRVKWCAAANWMKQETDTGVSSWSMFRPSKEGVSYADIAAHIAPRPMLLQYGTQDKLFPNPVLHNGQWTALTVQGIDSEHRFTREHMRMLLRWLEVQKETKNKERK